MKNLMITCLLILPTFTNAQSKFSALVGVDAAANILNYDNTNYFSDLHVNPSIGVSYSNTLFKKNRFNIDLQTMLGTLQHKNPTSNYLQKENYAYLKPSAEWYVNKTLFILTGANIGINMGNLGILTNLANVFPLQKVVGGVQLGAKYYVKPRLFMQFGFNQTFSHKSLIQFKDNNGNNVGTTNKYINATLLAGWVLHK